MDNAIYIVFSATPTRMGRLIRLATGRRYNHVSLSLEEDIRQMYSFARYHRAIPLYGGFVVESILRYRSFAEASRVKVCRIPVEETAHTYLCNYLYRLWTDREEYIYNTPAALASLVHFQSHIPKAYTCVSFVYEVLVRYHLAGAVEGKCPTLRGLEELLAPYELYRGTISPNASQGDWGRDVFSHETTTCYAVCTTARHFGRLAKRLVTGGA